MKLASITLSAAAFAIAAVAASPAQAATIVNLDGMANASEEGANGVTLNLAAGTYSLSFVQGDYIAFNRFSSTSGCDGDGKNCRLGWENSARYNIGADTHLFGDGAGTGGFGPLGVGDGYFSSDNLSFANSGAYLDTFTLDVPGAVTFFIYDDILTDNQGGVSLAISAVPEPATWLMMFVGIGAIGGFMRRKRVSVSVRYA